MIKKYYIITYGCQMNKSDSERIATVLENISYKPASKINEADLIVVNMCSVRQSVVDRVFGLAQKLSHNGNKKTIITGCILNKDRKKLSEVFDFILNIKDLPKWPKILNNLAVRNSRDREISAQLDYLKIKPKYFNKITAFVPISTGCNNFCAYCVVPHTRDRERARPAKEIICEIKNLIKKGCKEIWLLGQNVNSYKDKNIHPVKSARPGRAVLAEGEQFNGVNFPKLLKMVNDIPGEFWVRFTSPHPKNFSDELIDVMEKSKKYGHYLNLPVQSGDDKVLKKMNRSYTVAQYKNLVKKIRKKIPNITLSTDVIVGFPGETKKQFENSAKLFKKIKYDMAYIAEYSPRSGTAASKMKDNVPDREKIRRKKVLNEILKKTALGKNEEYIGKTVEALIMEHKTYNPKGVPPVAGPYGAGIKHFFIGKTREYKTIRVDSNKNLLGKFIRAKITDALIWGLKGKLIK